MDKNISLQFKNFDLKEGKKELLEIIKHSLKDNLSIEIFKGNGLSSRDPEPLHMRDKFGVKATVMFNSQEELAEFCQIIEDSLPEYYKDRYWEKRIK